MITCYFDGCCEPKNPGGHMGIGAVILEEDKRIFELSKHIPEHPNNSNNVAEYAAFNGILDYLIKNNKLENIQIFGDSKLVIEQMKGRWNINEGAYADLARLAGEKIKKFKDLKLSWIPREKNSLCDDLSKAPMIAAGVKFVIQPNDGLIRFPFGKFSGQVISECKDTQYLKWMYDTCKLKGPIKKEILKLIS